VLPAGDMTTVRMTTAESAAALPSPTVVMPAPSSRSWRSLGRVAFGAAVVAACVGGWLVASRRSSVVAPPPGLPAVATTEIQKLGGLEIRMTPCHRAGPTLTCGVRILNSTDSAIHRLRLDELQATTASGAVLHASGLTYDPSETGVLGRDGLCPPHEECRADFAFSDSTESRIARVDFLMRVLPVLKDALDARYRPLGKATFTRVVVE
jgi:hypothetical protein